MATALQAGDILSARVWTVLDEQAAVNTYNYRVLTVSGGAVTDQDFASAFDAIAQPFYFPTFPNTVEYRGTQVYFIFRTSGGPLPFPVKDTSRARLGSATGPPLPGNTAAILKYNTIFRGPGGRGRLYLPFTSDDFLAVNGTPTNAYAVLLNSYASVLLGTLTVTSGGSNATLNWVLVRKHKGAAPTVTGAIVAAESANKFGGMHKRGSYGRANGSPI